MMKIQTQGLCGQTVTVEEHSTFDGFDIDLQSLTTLKCTIGDRADIFDADHARRKGVYRLMIERVCPGCKAWMS